MKHSVHFILITFCLAVQLPAKALAETVASCQTTQSYTWPIKDPNGLMITKTAVISLDLPVSDLSEKAAKKRSAQAAWKTCRRNLGEQFLAHWTQLGSTLPFPLDEFGEARPPTMCEDYFNRPDLYTCSLIER